MGASEGFIVEAHGVGRLGNTALLIIDVHEGSVHPDGPLYVPGAKEVIAPTNFLASGLRKRGVPIFHVVQGAEDDGSDRASPYWRESNSMAELYPLAYQQTVGSRWANVAAGMEVESADKVLYKKRYGAFSGNGLQFQLRALDIETVILAGVETEICVLATAFEAFNSDFRVVIAEDCTKALDPSLGDSALRIVAREVGYVADARSCLEAESSGQWETLQRHNGVVRPKPARDL